MRSQAFKERIEFLTQRIDGGRGTVNELVPPLRSNRETAYGFHLHPPFRYLSFLKGRDFRTVVGSFTVPDFFLYLVAIHLKHG